MRKAWLLLLSIPVIIGVIMSLPGRALQEAPKTIEKIKEIAVIYNQNLAEFFNKLTPQDPIVHSIG